MANKTELWWGGDSPPNYKPIHSDGSVNEYGTNGITYRFNDFGYRCDNFGEPSDVPIVYLGCSVTEGIGLPIESTWGYLLNERIRAATNKKIPFWSLAQGGRGLDNQVKLLYEFTRRYPVKYIFCLFPPAGRREYVYGSDNLLCWLPNTNIESHSMEINKLFSDHHYMMHEDRKYSMMLDLIRSEQKAHVFTMSWHNTVPPDLRFEEFEHITSSGYDIDKVGKLRSMADLARDGNHPGKLYHTNLANQYWKKVKHLFQIGEQEGN